jgi:hypothetical protein
MFALDTRVGKMRQFVWKCVCMDVKTNYAVIETGLSDKWELYKQAFAAMVKQTGYLPMEVETDRFSGFGKFEQYCAALGVKVRLLRVGNARGKTVERVLGEQGDRFERFSKSFSGLNLRAGDLLSKEHIQEAVAKRLTLKDLEATVKEHEGWWNAHIMKRLHYVPCGKSPLAMLSDSATGYGGTKADSYLLWRAAGELRKIRLTRAGIAVREGDYEYHYFPDFVGGEAAEVDMLASFFNQNLGKRLHCYFIDKESKLLVMDENDKFIGFWARKPQVDYSPQYISDDSKKVLSKFLHLQSSQVKQAKQQVKQAKHSFAEDTGEALAKLYNKDKEAQQEAENLVKTEHGWVDTSTGELIEHTPDPSEEGSNSPIQHTPDPSEEGSNSPIQHTPDPSEEGSNSGEQRFRGYWKTFTDPVTGEKKQIFIQQNISKQDDNDNDR